jgi:hypothetical protein
MKHTLNRYVGLVLAAYAVLGGLFAVRTPAWQAPDEPAHYNYIAQVAAGTLLPVLAEGDWDNALLEQLKSERFAPPLLGALPSVQYEDHQPPLYYWLSAPVFALSGGNLTALRFMSLVWGGVTLAFTWRIARLVLPEQRRAAQAALALVAFLPQHLMIVSSVNNDALAGAVMAALLYACLRYRQDEGVGAARLGLLLGLAVLTKTTLYFMAAVVLLGVVLRFLHVRQSWHTSYEGMKTHFNADGVRVLAHKSALALLVRPLLTIALVAGVFALFWFGRNISVYGFPDIMGLRAHDAVVVGQPRTSDLVERIGFASYVGQLLTTTFQSFWGQFGWMSVPMVNVFAPGEALPYVYAGALVVMAALGLRRAPAPTYSPALARDYRRLLLSVLALSILVFLYYNTQFVQFQGRYLFTAIIPFALYMGRGLAALWHRLGHGWAAVLLAWLLAALDLWLIWRVIPGALGYTL